MMALLALVAGAREIVQVARCGPHHSSGSAETVTTHLAAWRALPDHLHQPQTLQNKHTNGGHMAPCNRPQQRKDMAAAQTHHAALLVLHSLDRTPAHPQHRYPYNHSTDTRKCTRQTWATDTPHAAPTITWESLPKHTPPQHTPPLTPPDLPHILPPSDGYSWLHIDCESLHSRRPSLRQASAAAMARFARAMPYAVGSSFVHNLSLRLTPSPHNAHTNPNLLILS